MVEQSGQKWVGSWPSMSQPGRTVPTYMPNTSPVRSLYAQFSQASSSLLASSVAELLPLWCRQSHHCTCRKQLEWWNLNTTHSYHVDGSRTRWACRVLQVSQPLFLQVKQSDTRTDLNLSQTERAYWQALPGLRPLRIYPTVTNWPSTKSPAEVRRDREVPIC